MKEKSTKPSPVKKVGKGIVRKVRKGKSSLQLMSLESFQAPIGGVDIHEPVAETIRQLPLVKGKGKGIATEEQAALSLLDLHTPKKKSTTDQYVFLRRTLATKDAPTGPSAQPKDDTSANIFRNTLSPTDAETVADTDKTNSKGDIEILNISEEQGEAVSNKVNLEEKTVEINEGQAGSDPGKTTESQPPPECILMEEDQAGPNPGQSHMALARPNPEPMHDDFIATVYPRVHESLKNTTDSTDSAVATHISALEQICANLAKINKQQDQTSQALSSRIFTLENHDLYSKIDKYFIKNVKEAIQDALKAPVHESFIELSEFEMKEILRDRMFESGSYQSHPKHFALYEALEASMERENREEFMDATAKSYSSSDLTDDIPIPDDMHLSDSENADADHLLQIKTRPDWLKPIPKKETPKTPEPDWVIPPNDLLEPENNWADEIAKSYQDPEEYKLLWKTRDMMEECHLLLTDKIDLTNPEGNRIVPDVSKPLHLGGPPGQLTTKTLGTKDSYRYYGLKVNENTIQVSHEDSKCGQSEDLLHTQDATDFFFKEDYTIVSKLRVVIYRYGNNQKKMMREAEVHKFSDGMLTRILEKLDDMVKDFRLFMYNLGMENRIWFEDDKRRSKEFMQVIERRLKIRKIFRNLKSFMSGRRSDTYAGNPVNEILLNLNLPDHRSVLIEPEVQEKIEMEIPFSSRVKFITACSYSTDTSKDIMKAQVYVSKLP
ncbi:hypothetical protein Tco_0496717, partial [Tanacetum coccineum]